MRFIAILRDLYKIIPRHTRNINGIVRSGIRLQYIRSIIIIIIPITTFHRRYHAAVGAEHLNFCAYHMACSKPVVYFTCESYAVYFSCAGRRCIGCNKTQYNDEQRTEERKKLVHDVL